MHRLLNGHGEEGRPGVVDKIGQLRVPGREDSPIFLLSGAGPYGPCGAKECHGFRASQVIRGLGAIVDKDGN